VSDIDGYAYHTPGLFLQAYRALFGGGLELNGSVRFDWHKDRGPNPSSFGRIISPRFTALWHHSTAWSSRFALGKGYRAPTSFFEQDHGILDTVLIEKRITEPEISHNASYALSYAGDRQAMVATANYNRLKNVALLDPNKCRPVAGGALTDSPCGPGEEKVTLFTSAQKPITVKGVDVSWTYRVTPALTSTLAAERFWYDLDPTEQTLTFVRPEKRAYLTLDYESGPWDGFFRVVWTGSQDLFKFYNQYGQRFHFDGTPKADRAPAFAWVDLRIAYRFDKRWSAFAGADNLFDYRQVRRDSPLWIDASGAPDVTHIWGPLRGRFLFAGVRADI
jgi:outer membrane receptor for ferrienterochelin and colicins